MKNKMSPDQVHSLPGLGPVGNTQFAGYASIESSKAHATNHEKLFYWFVGADDYENKPTILWTNGGPGSSSFWGFFLENGPYTIESAIGSYPVVRPNPTGWNNYANYMIFEHPLSVTLSFANNDDNVPKNPEAGAEDLYNALLNFVEMHPEIAKNPIILAGESYAGTYLPLLANVILEKNAKAKIKLDLRLTVLCDAWVDPEVQMAKNTEYAHTHGLISSAQKAMLDKKYPKNGSYSGLNWDIHGLCGCYMANTGQFGDPCFDPVLLYLNRDDVREAIHVPKGVQLVDTWSKKVSENYTPFINNSYRNKVQNLLNPNVKQKVQIVSGLNDAKDCNFLGTEAWLDLLTGKAARDLRAAIPSQWKNRSNDVIGFYQDGGTLSWLKVLNAGHLAVNDQPLIIEKILEKALE